MAGRGRCSVDEKTGKRFDDYPPSEQQQKLLRFGRLMESREHAHPYHEILFRSRAILTTRLWQWQFFFFLIFISLRLFSIFTLKFDRLCWFFVVEKRFPALDDDSILFSGVVLGRWIMYAVETFALLHRIERGRIHFGVYRRKKQSKKIAQKNRHKLLLSLLSRSAAGQQGRRAGEGPEGAGSFVCYAEKNNPSSFPRAQTWLLIRYEEWSPSLFTHHSRYTRILRIICRRDSKKSRKFVRKQGWREMKERSKRPSETAATSSRYSGYFPRDFSPVDLKNFLHDNLFIRIRFHRRICHNSGKTVARRTRRSGLLAAVCSFPSRCDAVHRLSSLSFPLWLQPVEFWACEMSPATPARRSRGPLSIPPPLVALSSLNVDARRRRLNRHRPH